MNWNSPLAIFATFFWRMIRTNAFRFLVMLVVFAGEVRLASAQVYKRSAGIRLDETSVGLTAVQRLFTGCTVEELLEFRQRDLTAALVPRVHTRLLGRRLNAYFGAGVHGGWVKVDAQRLNPYWGVGAMIGVEYKFHLLPIHVSYDFRPLVQLDGHPDLFGFQSGFSIRLVRKSDKKGWKESFRKWKEDTRDWLDGED